jgi:hypothetical protein
LPALTGQVESGIFQVWNKMKEGGEEELVEVEKV